MLLQLIRTPLQSCPQVPPPAGGTSDCCPGLSAVEFRTCLCCVLLSSRVPVGWAPDSEQGAVQEVKKKVSREQLAVRDTSCLSATSGCAGCGSALCMAV